MKSQSAECQPDTRELAKLYLLAKFHVVDAGYAAEIAWQESIELSRVEARQFLKEAAWVILCSGMRESVVRARFSAISEAFRNWDENEVASHPAVCVRSAISHFNHPGKLRSICVIAQVLQVEGIESLRRGLEREGPHYLMRFPYIGRATCYHLAKNLGFSTAKPDRHLVRMSLALGVDSVHTLCRLIAEYVGDSVQVVDIVLWRFATLRVDYLSWLMGLTWHEGVKRRACLTIR